ncbi:MAG: prepilin peptidase [Gemmatimonadota bacterium]
MSDEILVVAFAALLGAIIGSFLNVCILRLPSNQSIVRPPSRCPKCGQGVRWYDNIPVLSWLLLRGKCRHCRNPISAMYPMIELVVALVWAWCAYRWGPELEALKWALFSTILVGIAMTDAREFIIPNEFSFGGVVLGLGFASASGWNGFLAALGGACFGAGAIYLVGAMGRFALKKEAMGGGDVALMAMIGCFLGRQSVVATVFLGAVVGIILALGGRLVHRSKPETAQDLPDPPPVPRSTVDWLFFILIFCGVIASGVNGSNAIIGTFVRILEGVGVSYLVRSSVGLLNRRLVGRDEDANLLALLGVGLVLVLGWVGIRQPLTTVLAGGVLLVVQIVLVFLRPAQSDGMEEQSVVADAPPDVLEQLGYLPFGVSLAIVALIIALITGVEPVNHWFQNYGKLLGL